MRDEFSRTRLLLGDEAVCRLKNSRVAVFGLGGVGGHAADALARSAVGNLVLVDGDEVTISNINRQIVADHDTIGRKKVGIMRERISKINPAAVVETHDLFFLPDTDAEFLNGCDYIVDAVDTVAAKLMLVQLAREKKIPIISSMGAGNKLDPTRFEIADIYDTSVCPLCRVMRRELKRRGIPSLKVVFSTEPPARLHRLGGAQGTAADRSPGSVAFVPSVAGLILASEVVRDLTGNFGAAAPA